MFFESRLDPPAVSDAFAPLARLFAGGKAKEARRRAMAMRGKGDWKLPGDALLCSDLARAAAFYGEHFAIVRLGWRRFPHDRQLAFEAARVSANRRRWSEALRALEHLLEEAGPAQSVLCQSMLASVHAQMGFAHRSRGHRDKALEKAGELGGLSKLDPKASYELAFAELSLRRWPQAEKLAARAVAAAPRWSRARMILSEALIAQGEIARARAILEEGLGLGIEDASLELLIGLQTFYVGDHDQALERLIDFQYTWSRDRRGDNDIRAILPLLPWELAESPGSTSVLAQQDPELWQDLCRRPDPTRRCFLPIPAMRQGNRLCLPTAVAILAAVQGVQLEPKELFVAMTGRHGTPMWRMVEEMRQRGWRVEMIRNRPEILCQMLDAGLPLIGQLEGLFENHVEVICGYDLDKEIFFLRDPESWMPMAMPKAVLAERYLLSGDGVALLVAPESAVLDIPPAFLSEESSALVELERACVLGQRREAEEAAARIPDTSAAAGRRDLQARGVVLGPKEATDRFRRLASNATAEPLARLRALLALDSLEHFDEVLATLDEGESLFRPAALRLLRLSRLRLQGRWPEIEALASELAARYPQMEMAWTHRAEALAQMGRLQGARECIEAALDLAPDSAHVRGFVRQIFPTLRTYGQDRREIEELIEHFPHNPRLKVDLASILASGPDGLELERALGDAIRYFPRLPQGYLQLTVWYLVQDRLDLAASCLKEGRALLGEEELPFWGFELDRPEEAPAQEATTEEAPTESAAVPLTGVDSEIPGQTTPAATAAVDREALWAAAEKEIFPHRAGGQKPEGYASFEALLGLRSQGLLPWNEEARLVAFEIHRAIDGTAQGGEHGGDVPGGAGIGGARAGQEGPAQKVSAQKVSAQQAAAEEVTSLLPPTLAGPVQSALGIVLDTCEAALLPRRVAVEILAWAEARIGDLERPASLEFQISLLHELCGDSSAAEARYRDLIARHPGYSAPFFRLGMILAGRGDIAASAKAHRQALEGDPGLDSSRQMLISAATLMMDTEEALEALAAQCRRFPYQAGYLEDLLLRQRAAEGSAAALDTLDGAAARFPDATVVALKALILLEDGSFAEARALLREHADLWAEEARPARLLELRVALGEGDLGEARRVVDEILEESPGDAWLLLKKGEILAEQEPGSLLSFFRSVLEEGLADENIAEAYLDQMSESHSDAAIELLSPLEGDPRAVMAWVLALAMAKSSTVPERIELLEWCREALPREVELRDWLARLLAWSDRTEEALEVAQELVDEDPESPKYMELMAYCLQSVDMERSLEYLERQYELSRSLDTLLQIALARHSLDDPEKAKVAYRQVLERFPGHDLALVNLHQLGVPVEELHGDLVEALRHGRGEETSFLHLMAAEAAMARSEPLPEEWIGGAQRRFEQLLEMGDPCPERLRLGILLALCHADGGDLEGAEIYRRQAGRWWRRAWERYGSLRSWPRNRAWMPQTTAVAARADSAFGAWEAAEAVAEDGE